jgi:hypothetical protein
MFSKEGVDQEINFYLIDIPCLYDYKQGKGDEFFEALAGTDDYSLFTRTVV